MICGTVPAFVLALPSAMTDLSARACGAKKSALVRDLWHGMVAHQPLFLFLFFGNGCNARCTILQEPTAIRNVSCFHQPFHLRIGRPRRGYPERNVHAAIASQVHTERGPLVAALLVFLERDKRCRGAEQMVPVDGVREAHEGESTVGGLQGGGK
jgi:hypothetical protein